MKDAKFDGVSEICITLFISENCFNLCPKKGGAPIQSQIDIFETAIFYESPTYMYLVSKLPTVSLNKKQ